MKKKPNTQVFCNGGLVSIENSAGLVVFTQSEAKQVLAGLMEALPNYKVSENPILDYEDGYIVWADDVVYFLENYGTRKVLTDVEWERLRQIAYDLEDVEETCNHRNSKYDKLIDRALLWINRACVKHQIRAN